MLERWAVRGVERLGEGAVKGKVKLTEGRPLDRNAVQQSRASIDSLYKNAGYYAAEVKALELPQQNGKMRIVFDIKEGERVAISQVVDRRQQALHRRSRSCTTWPPSPKASAGSRRASTTRTSWSRTSGSACPRGTPTGASSTSRSPTTACIADSVGWEGRPPPHRGRGPGLSRRHLRHGGQPALLPRGAADLLPLRSAVAGRGHRSGSGRSARPSGTGPPKSSRTSTPTTATSTPRWCPRRAGGPGRTARRWWTCAGPSGKARRPRSTRSRSWGTTSPTSG